MRGRLILAGVALASLAAPALADDHDKVSRSELRHDEKRVAEEQKDLSDAYKLGDRKNIADQKRDLADAQRELRQDRRDAYNAGLYHRPRGWRTHSWAVGERLPAGYYTRTYWVTPGRYGLAAPARGERWVRVDRDVIRIAPDGTVREVRRSWFR